MRRSVPWSMFTDDRNTKMRGGAALRRRSPALPPSVAVDVDVDPAVDDEVEVEGSSESAEKEDEEAGKSTWMRQERAPSP